MSQPTEAVWAERKFRALDRERMTWRGLRNLSIASLAAAVVMLGWVLFDARRIARDQAAEAAAPMAAALSYGVEQGIGQYARAVQRAAAKLGAAGAAGLSTAARTAEWRADFDGLPIAAQVMVLDQAGRVAAEPEATTSPAVATGRDYAVEGFYQAHRGVGDIGLFVGPTCGFEPGGAPGICISRRIAAPDGGFVGVMAAWLPASIFDRLVGQIELNRGDILALFHANGMLVTRAPGRLPANLDYRSSPLFKAFAAAPSGVFAFTSPLDGTRHLGVYRQVGMHGAALPLIVSVAPSMTSVYADWWHKALIVAGGALLLGCVAGLLIRLLLLQLRRRIEAEEVVKASEAKFRTCFEHLTDGVLVLRVAADGGLLYEEANRAGLAMLGLAAEDVIGRPPDEVWPAEAAAFGHDGLGDTRMRQSIVEGRVITYAREIARPAGARQLSVTLAAVHDAQGRVCRLVESIVDVTEREQLEEQLRHAQKMEAIGRLTAGIAHDFNNLLQAQAGSLELLMEEVTGSSRAHEYARIAMGSTERAAQLTHHLLAFAGKQVLLPEAVPMAALLAEAGEAIGRLIGPLVAVELACDGDVPAVFVDRAQLRMTLINLAINARDAMPRGGRLQVRAGGEQAPGPGAPGHLAAGGYVLLSVSDTGMGMDAETLARACDPFFSTKGALVSGLGLSMVQGFARQSGGELRLSSTPGEGTCVALWLPCVVGAASDKACPSQGRADRSGSGVGETGGAGGGGRVLLVDDSPDVLLTTGAFLEGAGFDVVRAENGDQALVVLAAGERFDALVTDYAMPALNGAELILQALHLQPSLAALIITGFAEVAGLETLPGQVQVLRKPFRRDELVRRLRGLVAARQGAVRVTAPA